MKRDGDANLHASRCRLGPLNRPVRTSRRNRFGAGDVNWCADATGSKAKSFHLRSFAAGLTVLCMAAGAAPVEWTLADNLDNVLAYTERTYELFRESPAKDRWQGARGGLLMRTVTKLPDGTLKPYAPGMAVNGEIREGQLLLSGAQALWGACVEFAVFGGSRMSLLHGLCDQAVQHNNEGSHLLIEITTNGKTQHQSIRIDRNEWGLHNVRFPQAEFVQVRLISRRLNTMNTNWTGLVVSGDGRIGTLEETRANCPHRDKLCHLPAAPTPSKYRAAARKGADILYYRGKPFLSFAGKGHATGTHAEQAAVGINTFYTEGANFSRLWPEGADSLDNSRRTATRVNLALCQRHDMVYKTAMSMAHCTPFLPPWLVQEENLGFEGHQMRRGGPHHASIFKDKTLRFYKQGLEAWIQPLIDQPVIFVFSQEDIPEDLDDYSEEAKAKWITWLKRRFENDFEAFATYVGGVTTGTDFPEAPYPEAGTPHSGVGYPMRLAYLKLIWIQETFGDFLANVYDFTRGLAPGVPLTQRYTNSPFGVFLSKRVGSDYNYTFGHLSVEGWPNAYGIGMKPCSGLYAHAGTLPLPRGGSIGKTYSRDIRRGKIDEAEFRRNAYTAAANGLCGFEYSTVFPSWGPRWTPSSLYTRDGELTGNGHAAKAVMSSLLELTHMMVHYEKSPDVAVFHDAPFNSRGFAGSWSQSKAGVYVLIRQTGFHADVLTCWDMTAENLRGRKVLVLAGSLSIAPEIQDAVREYVRGGGTLVTVFCADAGGFPGSNSYAYAEKPRESTAVRCFEDPPAVAHLGDVLGIRSASGCAAHTEVRTAKGTRIPLGAFNALAEQGRWVDHMPCAQQLVPAENVRITGTFEDGSPAIVENAFGRGRSVSFAFDLGLVANSLTVEPAYALWSDLMLSLGCRKTVDSGNWYIEAGAWHNDQGQRVVFLVNHDTKNARTAKLEQGLTVRLAPGESKALVLKLEQ